ncbi:hypothetical protein DERF_008548 [Dermatophagoides farinae]|uniref:Sodium/potassium-transporting ATPase subunit beta-1-interacting protein n=1 Tax=Dermatophagoides farinae TaxID=6954 RepID=A0A922L9A8_DERFA|nr:hypothetical protein DERF_008548 [Dermatophagoides farinae]
MSVRIIIKIFLTLQLLLLIFRQMIDFAGIQWLMILVNALAIIITITGFFGHLLIYASFQIFLIIYNIYVICVYARFITLDTITDTFGTGDMSSLSLSSATTTTNLYKSIIDDHQSNYPIVHTSPLLPSTQLLSFDINSRSFWYIIVSNHISNIQAHLNHYNQQQQQQQNHNINNHNHESLVDLCVQYIEIAIASLHIFISILAIGLILLKYKLERDKFLRNNDKTTPPLPPYTINPQMNHYMSFTPTTITTTKSSLYNQKTNSVRRSSKRRRSTRSLHTQKSKSNSLGALNNIRANSSGSLRSTISKHGHHRKSATSLLMMNNNNNNVADASFISSNNTTIGSRSGAKSSHSNYGQIINNNNNNNNNGLYGTIISTPVNKPTVPLRNQQRQHQNLQHQQQYSYRHSIYGGGCGGGGQQNSISSVGQSNYGPKFVTSDSETDNYYHTFTPAYLNNGLANPLYGKRNSYMDSSETAI